MRTNQHTDFFVGRTYGSDKAALLERLVLRVALMSVAVDGHRWRLWREELVDGPVAHSAQRTMHLPNWGGWFSQPRAQLNPSRHYPQQRADTIPMSAEQPYPLIDADPHAARVIRYMRPSDYAVWAGATGGFPAALYLWGACRVQWLPVPCPHILAEMADPTKAKLRTPLRLGGLLGFIGGFMLAYQRSSSPFH